MSGRGCWVMSRPGSGLRWWGVVILWSPGYTTRACAYLRASGTSVASVTSGLVCDLTCSL